MTTTTNTPSTPAAPADTSAGVAAAIDAGIAAVAGGASPPAPVVNDSGEADETQNQTDGAGDAGTSGDGADGTPAPDGDGAGSGADAGADGGEPAGDGEADAPDGDGDKDGDAADAGKGGEKPAGSKDGKPAAKKEPDHFNDPLPNALKPETKERIRFLVKTGKEAIARAETAETERNEVMDQIIATKATPEQYAQTLDYLEMVNSGDRTKMIKAANYLISELSALSRIGGFRIPGITTYSGHPDLEEKVQAGQLTPELAEEIAATRAAAAHQTKAGAAQQRMAQARQQYQQVATQARQDLNAAEAEIAKNDPLYKAKKPLIIKMLNRALAGDRANGVAPVHPSRWVEVYKDIYANLPATAAPAPAPGGGAPRNTPLRASQPAGGGAMTKEPKTMAEALELGISLAGG